MTTNLDAIFSQYRKADFYDRLNIFLQFPELRREFLEIEQKEDQPNFFGTAVPPSKGLNRIGRWIHRKVSFKL